jgi:hypothetical protein
VNLVLRTTELADAMERRTGRRSRLAALAERVIG